MAVLARVTSEDGPGPLEGLHPNALVGRGALGASGRPGRRSRLARARRRRGRALRARVRVAGRARAAEIGRRVLAGSSRPMRPRSSRWRGGWRSEAGAGRERGTRFAHRLGRGASNRPRDRRRAACARAGIATQPRTRMDRRPVDGLAALASPGGAAHRTCGGEAARRAAQGDDHSLRVFKGDAVASPGTAFWPIASLSSGVTWRWRGACWRRGPRSSPRRWRTRSRRRYRPPNGGAQRRRSRPRWPSRPSAGSSSHTARSLRGSSTAIPARGGRVPVGSPALGRSRARGRDGAARPRPRPGERRHR